MPLNAVGWSTVEDENLVKLVEPHTFLYNILDPSRKNILARESTWQEIAQALSKPVEECKKRWRGIRDGYMRSKRMGTVHRTKADIFEKLHFLDALSTESEEEVLEEEVLEMDEGMSQDEQMVASEEQVITDNQEYYEITMVDGATVTSDQKPSLIKIIPKIEQTNNTSTVQKRMRRGGGRKKSQPMPRNIAPIKILPKPVVMNGPKIVRYLDTKTPELRSQVIDKIIEKLLKENTNDIDIFFRCMSASVKKLQPNVIPMVKMEVCNVIAKYEMQNFQ